MSERNEEGRSPGDRTLADGRTGTISVLAEWPGRDWKVNHRPNARRDDIRGWRARKPASSAHETSGTGAISRRSFRHLPSVTGKEVLQLSVRFAEPIDAWWEG